MNERHRYCWITCKSDFLYGKIYRVAILQYDASAGPGGEIGETERESATQDTGCYMREARRRRVSVRLPDYIELKSTSIQGDE